MEKKLHCKPIELDLVGIDGNAFSLMGVWRREAKKQDRTSEEIEAVLKDCQSGDYNNLLQVLIQHSY